MKFCTIIYLVLALNFVKGNVLSHKNERMLEEEVIKMLECLRRVLKDGIEEVGMPSFEPLEINELLINLEELNLSETIGYVKLNKLSIAGLTDWDLSQLSIKIGIVGGIRVSLGGDLLLPKTEIKTGYSANLTAEGVEIYGDGVLSVGLDQVGLAVDTKVMVVPLSIAKFRLVPRLNDIDFKITGFLNDEEHSALVSELGNILIPRWVNEKAKDIADAIEQAIEGLINGRRTQDSKDINDIINAILKKCPLAL